MSFKQAVISPTRLPVTSSHCNTLEKRLAEAELSLKEHKQNTRRLEEHGLKLEELDRLSRRHNLILYNLSEDLNDPLTEVWERVEEKYRHDLCIDGPPERLGTPSVDNSRPRPLRVKFGTLQGKHLFLKHAKVLRQAGFKVDDDLTRLQQQEQKSLGDDFAVLKTKGHTPFFRGSQLHFYADRMQTCRNGKASTIPPADDRQAKDHGSIESLCARYTKNLDSMIAMLGT